MLCLFLLRVDNGRKPGSSGEVSGWATASSSGQRPTDTGCEIRIPTGAPGVTVPRLAARAVAGLFGIRLGVRGQQGCGVSSSAAPHAEPEELIWRDDLLHGQCSGDTGYFGCVGGLPLEQMPDDERALYFDGLPPDGDLCIVGHACLRIDVTPGSLPAPFACRICDIAPDGRSGLVTRTVINLGRDDDQNTVRRIAPLSTIACMSQVPDDGVQVRSGPSYPPGARFFALSVDLAVWPSGAVDNLDSCCQAEPSVSPGNFTPTEQAVSTRHGHCRREGIAD